MTYKQDIVSKVIKAMKDKDVKWNSPVVPVGLAFNPVSNTVYKMVNQFLLTDVGFSDPRFVTFNQASVNKWKIKKGSKGYPLIRYAEVEKRGKAKVDEEVSTNHSNGKMVVLVPCTVFNAEQIEGIEPYFVPAIPSDDVLLDHINSFVSQYQADNGPSVVIGGNECLFSPSTDTVKIPHANRFKSVNQLLEAVIHECAHSTAIEKRLNRDNAMSNRFGDDHYAFEELVAQLSVPMMCQFFNVSDTNSLVDNSAAYVNSWIKRLDKDPDAFYRAVALSNDVCTYLCKYALTVQPGHKIITIEEVSKPKPKRKLKTL